MSKTQHARTRFADAGLTLLVGVAVACYVLAAFAAQPAGTTTDDAPSQPPPPDPQAVAQIDGLPGPIVGVSINLYHLDDHARLTAAIDRIADLGFNTLQIVTPVFQRDGAAPAPRRQVGPLFGPTDDTLRLALDRAQQRGLSTKLMMQVNFTHPRGNEWRGKLLPPDWPPWWAGYRAALLDFADLAAQADADALSVGCELLTTQQPSQADAWRQTIAHVRERFDGTLYYSTNWDAYASFPCWAELDAIGISGYWDLTRTAVDRDAPTDTEVLERWTDIQAGLVGFADRLDRPLLVSEVGYPALPWALRNPWNYLLGDAELDTTTQARAYRLLANAWSPLLEDPNAPVKGLVLYEWDIYHDPTTHTGYAIDRPATLDALRPLLDAAQNPTRHAAQTP